MNIYGLEKMSLLDYDNKICATLFTCGCNFKCPFCHNSSLVNIDKSISPLNNEEIFSFLKRRVGTLDAVTITGGEPTLNNDLIDFIKQIKELGYLIKLDTNGTNPEMIKYLLKNKLIDYVAMDIKNSFDKYPLTAGSNNINLDNIKKSINFLINSNYDYEFRTTVVKEFHTKEDFIKINEMIKGAKKYRLQKFVDNKYCIKKGLHEIPLEEIQSYTQLLNNISDVSLRGY
ncbi:MAG: anaerobic ribonucleoside-triphosphate reductase activating protein [Bacilli bacterium]